MGESWRTTLDSTEPQWRPHDCIDVALPYVHELDTEKRVFFGMNEETRALAFQLVQNFVREQGFGKYRIWVDEFMNVRGKREDSWSARGILQYVALPVVNVQSSGGKNRLWPLLESACGLKEKWIIGTDGKLERAKLASTRQALTALCEFTLSGMAVVCESGWKKDGRSCFCFLCDALMTTIALMTLMAKNMPKA